MTLAAARSGWENEHLATYLLSRIAFVARPATVADDTGTDLYCTIFERVGHSLRPRSSLAVQVKSNRSSIDMSAKIDYLSNLELPYYVGVVNRAEMELTLFSGRFLPAMISYRGDPKSLRLDLVDDLEGAYRIGDEESGYRVRCPRVAVLRARDTAEELQQGVEDIREDLVIALGNVVTRLNREFIFEVPGGFEILAGRTSARVFLDNFWKRLAEVYYNLAWLIRAGAAPSNRAVDVFLALQLDLEATTGGTLPEYVATARKHLKEALRGLNGA